MRNGSEDSKKPNVQSHHSVQFDSDVQAQPGFRQPRLVESPSLAMSPQGCELALSHGPVYYRKVQWERECEGCELGERRKERKKTWWHRMEHTSHGTWEIDMRTLRIENLKCKVNIAQKWKLMICGVLECCWCGWCWVGDDRLMKRTCHPCISKCPGQLVFICCDATRWGHYPVGDWNSESLVCHKLQN